MGQLIKLQDYVSRYEQNIYLYPSRYVRLKKQQWDKLKQAWELGEDNFFSEQIQNPHEAFDWLEEDKQPFMDKLKGLLKLGRKESVTDEPSYSEEEKQTDEDSHDEGTFGFDPIFSYRPDNQEELKQLFLDQIFRFQMKWASSTISEKSFIDKAYYYDEKLKYFLQRFPDTFLVLYAPLFLLKKAPVEVDPIILTPTGAWCISFLEEEDMSVFIGSKERFWVKRVKGAEKKVLNPILSLNRTAKIAQQIFNMHDIDLPIHKAVLCRNGYIDFPALPFDIKLIEKRNHDEWFTSMRNLRSPLKHMQLKAAQALLQYCQTTSIRRLEWEISDED